MRGLNELRQYIDSEGGMELSDCGSGMISVGYHGACILAATLNRRRSQKLLGKSRLSIATPQSLVTEN
jgi:hypothetical protein